MNLKKNDKIILIVGVVILIIAGAGIALYNTPSDSSDIENMIDDDKSFEYTWSDYSGSKTLDNPMVEKDTLFSETWSIESPAGTVLTDIKVNIQLQDDNTFGLLRTKGQDVLSATVSCDGKSMDGETTLEGNENFSYDINSKPSDGTKEGSSQSDVESLLSDEFDNMNKANVKVELSIETGEPAWRILKNRRDQGNEVEISVEYKYYRYSLDEVEDDMKQSGSDEDDVTVSSHYLGEFYVNLGYGRGMI